MQTRKGQNIEDQSMQVIDEGYYSTKAIDWNSDGYVKEIELNGFGTHQLNQHDF